APPASRPANLVKNGGFEQPPVGPANNNDCLRGHDDLPGWRIEAGNGDGCKKPWQPSEGGQIPGLNGDTRGVIFQDIATTPGRWYRVRFALAGNPDGGAGKRTMEVQWGSKLLASVSVDSTGHTMGDLGWEYHEYRVQAQKDSTELGFI